MNGRSEQRRLGREGSDVKIRSKLTPVEIQLVDERDLVESKYESYGNSLP